ncbi:extracellular solute-binding protein [Martelella alba]|uniref:Extracellular solute-binding protein n=1 Tax=Martelella alba TaxID=2590451 RepID=A0A506U3X7_9HYPH|nr:extracellular solute-binding protein [Martelella alba]TPW29093.1 extracellular solute-binding protein [Martelella alba]
MNSRLLPRVAALLCTAAAIAAGPVAAHADDVITSWDLRSDAVTAGTIRDAADRFEAANPGYKVEDSHFANDAYKTKLKIGFGANQPPCVFASWGGGPLKEYVDAGQVMDMTPYLDKDPAFKDRFIDASFGPVTFDGKIYGIPAENTGLAVVFYNKDMFAEYGLTPPKTWDDLMNIIQVLNDHNVAPFALANKNKWPGLMYYGLLVDRVAGPGAYQAASTGSGSFTDPAFVEAGTLLQDLVKANAFAKGYNGLDYDIGGSRRLLYANKAAMEVMGTWELSSIINENPSFADKVDFFTFPSVPDGKGDPSDVLGTLGDNYISVSEACPYKDKAFELATYMTDDTAAADRLANQRMMPLKNIQTDDPFLQKVANTVANAQSVQLWYDQDLPPAVGEATKDAVQELFGLSITPEQAAQQIQDAASAKASN